MYAKYTVVLKELMENEQTKPMLDKALSTYTLYEKKSKEEFIPSYVPTRSELNQKILNHYKYREIGFETVGRFLDELEIAMIEIMPRYNLLFLTADQDFNIIWNVDYLRTTDRNLDDEKENTNTQVSTGNVSGSVNTTGTVDNEGITDTESADNTSVTSTVDSYSKDVHSATPQGELSITSKDIDNVTYADDVSWKSNETTDESESNARSTGTTEFSNSSTTTQNQTNQSDSTGNVTNDGTEKQKQIEHTEESVRGNYGQVSAQSLILTYRETIINIEQMIIKDRRIQDLFMKVW